jgi:hypothetical protein
MTEVPLSPEAQELLPKAVNEVGGMYLGDRLSALLESQSPEQRDEDWQQSAKVFPPFAEKITELRQSLKIAATTRKGYPESVADAMSLYFSKAGDEFARELLTDMLFARTTKTPGYVDYSMNSVEEANAMAVELGVQDGFRGDEMKNVNLDNVVEAILVEKLKLTRQTQLGEK